MAKISFTVNGQAYSLEVEPDTPLLYVLRNDLGLTGTKFGCGLEQCGACTVIKDGVKTFACNMEMEACQNSDILTIEGLGTVDHLHPIQQAFIDERAAQCGYCIPGIIVTTKALLDKDPNPSEKTIRQALSDNLCRCGTHTRIIKAVKRAIKEMQS